MAQATLSERDLKALRVFKAAALAGGFAAAERQLCMTRSTISKYIRDAERSLGARLCERGPKGFVLLEAGEAALRATSDALDAVERIRSDVEATKGILTGSISIGVADNLIIGGESRVSQALRRIADKAPLVTFDVAVASPQRLKAVLLDGGVDLIVSPDDSDRRLHCRKLFTETVALYQCRDGRKSALPGSLPLIMRPGGDVPMTMIKLHGFKAGPVATDLEAVATLVTSGAYIGVLPIYYARLLQRRFPLRRVAGVETYTRPFSAIVLKRRVLPRACAELLEALVEVHAVAS